MLDEAKFRRIFASKYPLILIDEYQDSFKIIIDKFKDYIFVSFDAIMEAHPQYQKDVKELGAIKAFQKWEIPARIAGYELLRRAVATKKNIFFDHSGAPKCHQNLLKDIKKHGYKTEMYYIYCSPELAVQRAQARELETKSFIVYFRA